MNDAVPAIFPSPLVIMDSFLKSCNNLMYLLCHLFSRLFTFKSKNIWFGKSLEMVIKIMMKKQLQKRHLLIFFSLPIDNQLILFAEQFALSLTFANFFFFLYIFRFFFVYTEYLCRPSEANTRYCAILGSNPPKE